MVFKSPLPNKNTFEVSLWPNKAKNYIGWVSFFIYTTKVEWVYIYSNYYC